MLYKMPTDFIKCLNYWRLDFVGPVQGPVAGFGFAEPSSLVSLNYYTSLVTHPAKFELIGQTYKLV